MYKSVHIIILALLVGSFGVYGQQNAYADSMTAYQQRYVKKHDVVRGNDKKNMHFFPVSEKYKVPIRFERIDEAPWFKMQTSGKVKKTYRVYGILHFSINDTTLKLYVYQSQDLMEIKQYEDHLFIPFTDLTSGEESYDNGRYIDMTIADLEKGTYQLDFNKAYNPYCAYVSDKYNCPVPPRENDLPVAIRAGEMKFGKSH
jgi:uncharacterized protein